MKFRIISLLLAVLMLSAVFVSCANTEDPTEVTTDGKQDETTAPVVTTDPNVEYVYVDVNGYEIDSIPADTNLGGKKIKILAQSDYVMLEFEPTSETQNADIVNDAILLRNQKVEERLGIELTYEYTPGNADNMSQYMQRIEADAVEGTFDAYASYSRVAPKLAIEGKNADLLSLESLEFSKPWWNASLVDEFKLGDKLFFCSGDISTNLLWMMEATFYNQKLLKDYNLEDPYDLVVSNDWTMSKFIQMNENTYSDNLNDGKTEDDNYGLALYSLNIDAYQTGCGIFPIKNNDGTLELSGDFTQNKVINLINDLRNFVASNNVYSLDTVKARNVFFQERAVFMTDRVFVIAGKDNSSNQNKIEFVYGVVPNPKYNKAQSRYYTNLGHPFTMYAITSYISDERQADSALVLECLASESYRQVTPNVYEVAMKVKYSPDDKSAEMFDLIKSSVVFESGRLFDIGGSYFTANAFRKSILSTTNKWISTYKSSESAILLDLEKINKTFSD